MIFLGLTTYPIHERALYREQRADEAEDRAEQAAFDAWREREL